MKILLVGALSWNPERVTALTQRGHRLYGLWTRTMGWEQGPYPFLDEIIETVDLQRALELLGTGEIDLVYSLFQVYPRDLWAESHHDLVELWPTLRLLLDERDRGRHAAPVVRHWGFDVDELDLHCVQRLDGQIFCNEEQRHYWQAPAGEGGLGLELGTQHMATLTMDGDLPSDNVMHDDFARLLSAQDGEIHTVCVGRPLGIDLLRCARAGIHVHLYGNDFDRLEEIVARDHGPLTIRQLRDVFGQFVHVHDSLQPRADTLAGVWQAKRRWVPEFSRYDAGWSYVGTPFPWTPLEDRAVIPNRLTTYLSCGLPVIATQMPGHYRYEFVHRRGVAVDLVGDDYEGLAVRLRDRKQMKTRRVQARQVRRDVSFDAQVDDLLSFFEGVVRAGARSRAATTSADALPVSSRFIAPRRLDRLRSMVGHRVTTLRRRASRLSAKVFLPHLGEKTSGVQRPATGQEPGVD